MKKIGWIPLLLAAAFGVGLLLAVRSGWANYFWDRIAYGRTIVVLGQCFDLPSRWTVMPGSQQGTQDVRRHFVDGGAEAFASVLPSSAVAAAVPLGRAPVVINGFGLYDFGPNSAGGPIRYLALNSASSVAILASRDSLLRELAMNLTQCQ